MDSSPQMLLNVWREVSRHIRIDESVTRVMPLLSPGLPLDALLVRHVDLARTSLETVAAVLVRPVRPEDEQLYAPRGSSGASQ